jgi:hypothetical protein
MTRSAGAGSTRSARDPIRPLAAAVAQRLRHRPRDLLARARDDGVAERLAPAIVVHRFRLESEVAEHGRVIEVRRELLGPPARRDVLRAMQGRTPLARRQVQQVGRDHRNRATRASFPRRIRGGLDHDLPNHAPTGVVGLAARDEKARERLRQDGRIGLCAERVEVAQGLADATAVLDSARQFARPTPRSALNAGRRQPAPKVLRVMSAIVAARLAPAARGSSRSNRLAPWPQQL